jgi:DTW domain-containing protein YfiP
MQHYLCICHLIPQIKTMTRLVLIVHHREIRKPTNTGGLAAKCLVNSEIHVRGSVDHPVPYSEILDGSHENLYLFPSPEAKVLSQDLIANITKPIRLVVPDGNWGQASRVARRIPSNVPMTHIILPAGAPTQYRLRKEPVQRPEGLATMEAIARALSIIEGPKVEQELLHIFRIMVERSLLTKGKIRADAVYGGLAATATKDQNS